MVITVEIYKQIRKMRLDGMSQRQIAATLHISRNTVKKYWDGDRVPWERKDYSREASVLTEDVVAFVRRCLDEDSHCKSRKQHHTAKRIYDRLVTECGFTGGETTIRRLVKELREKSQEAFVPLAFPAGDALQIDWGEATVYLDGAKSKEKIYLPDKSNSTSRWNTKIHPGERPEGTGRKGVKGADPGQCRSGYLQRGDLRTFCPDVV